VIISKKVSNKDEVTTPFASLQNRVMPFLVDLHLGRPPSLRQLKALRLGAERWKIRRLSATKLHLGIRHMHLGYTNDMCSCEKAMW
jgi:hypothetical protein